MPGRFSVLVTCLGAMMLLGCAQSRIVTITAKPADAVITVNGVARGRGPITQRFVFNSPSDVHLVRATRKGYVDRTETVTLESPKGRIAFDLKPQTREIYFRVEPVAAMISIDGKLVKPEPLSAYSATLELGVDDHNEYVKHTVTAERPNFLPAKLVVSWPDRNQNYVLNLEPMRKDLMITSSPSGADVFIDDEKIGTTPWRDKDRSFPVDITTNQFATRTIKVEKPGFQPTEREISWDEGKIDYHFDLEARSKTVRIITDPRDATITVEGQQVQRDENGVAKLELKFLPINDTGELRTFTGTATKSGGEDGDWEPTNFTIGWDEGKTSYLVPLKEVVTRPVPLLTALWTYDGEWEVSPKVIQSISAKDLTDGAGRPTAIQVTHLPKGTNIDTIALSPDGQRIVFSALSGNDSSDFRSQMFVVRVDGEAGTKIFSDGKSLDLTPSYTPGGDTIVFASNRGGKHLSIWQMSAGGAGAATQRSVGDTNDIWPVVDSDPRPRLYYQSMHDNRGEPRLFSTLLSNMLRTDLQTTGMQPRISPKNDVIVFTSFDEKTGKRDIFSVPVGGGTPTNLTGTPDIDEFDPVFNSNGSKIAFTSDRGIDTEKRNNFDIWMMDINKPEQLQQLTINASQDDCPAWDPSGRFIYFRSNRGGDWNVWKIPVK